MNLYAAISDVKTALGLSSASTTYDDLIGIYIDAASRRVDSVAHRHFYTMTDTRRFTRGMYADHILIDDLLSATAITGDDDGDETYGETWTAGTDYVLESQHIYPKTELRLHLDGDKTIGRTRNYIRIAGTFGYGDGASASPWQASSITGTVATTSGTTLTASAAGLKAGQTILCESEQMYISAVSGTSATVTRGVNGTTAATHSAKVISTALYPSKVVMAVYALVGEMWNHRTAQGMRQVMAGNFQEMYKDAMKDEVIARILGSKLRRLDR